MADGQQATMLSHLLEFLSNPANRGGVWLVALTTAFGVFFWLFSGEGRDAAERQAHVAALRHDPLPGFYSEHLNAWLNWMDARLSKTEIWRHALRDRGALGTCFSFGLLNVTMAAALTYPALLMAIQWGLGGDGRIGATGILSTSAMLWHRIALLGGFGIALAVFVFAGVALRGVAKKYIQYGAFFASIWLASLGVDAVMIAILIGFVFIYTFPAAAFTMSSIVVAFSLYAGFGDGDEFNVLLPVAIFLALIFNYEETFFKTKNYIYGIRWQNPAVFQIILSVVSICIVFSAAALGPNSLERRGVLLFLCILPLLNGLADFASAGATRWFLRRAVWWAWIADLLAGLVIFLSLGCAIIVVVAFMPVRGVDGYGRLLDLPVLFSDLDGPAMQEHWWLLVMLFSTLLPTLIHAFLGIGAIVFRLWPRRLHADLLDSGATRLRHAKIGEAMLATRATLALVVPAFVILELWIAVSPTVVHATITIFRAFALAIGAIA
jgi:hypothetical protein